MKDTDTQSNFIEIAGAVDRQPPSRTQLEPLTAAHAAELFPVLCDPAVYAFIPDRPPASAEALAERYHRLESRTSPDGSQRWLNWAIRLVEDRRCIGFVQATIHAGATADLAFVLGREYWGLGLAGEASAKALAQLFIEFHVESVFATVDRRNLRSAALLRRLGFHLVSAAIYPHGPVESTDDVFQLTRHDPAATPPDPNGT